MKEIKNLKSEIIPNPDFAIQNLIFRSIKDYVLTNLRLQTEQSTSAFELFTLVCQSVFRFSCHLTKLLSDCKIVLVHRYTQRRLVPAKVIYTPPLFYAAKGPVTLNSQGSEDACIFSP